MNNNKENNSKDVMGSLEDLESYLDNASLENNIQNNKKEIKSNWPVIPQGYDHWACINLRTTFL